MTTENPTNSTSAQPQVEHEDANDKSIKDRAHDLSSKAKANVGEAKAKASEKMGEARQSASDAYGRTRQKGSELYDTNKAKLNAQYTRGKAAASKAGEKAKRQLESTPLAVLAGGAVLGALVAAVIPESEREKRVLGSTGKKINNRAKDAAAAAKSRGTEKVDELGLNSEALKDQLNELLEKGLEILKSAGKAAGKAAANKD